MSDVRVEIHFTMPDGSCVVYKRDVPDSPLARRSWDNLLNHNPDGTNVSPDLRPLGMPCHRTHMPDRRPIQQDPDHYPHPDPEQ